MPVLVDVLLLAGVPEFNDIRISFHACVGMPDEIAPTRCERHLVLRRERLAWKYQHVMAAKQLLDFRPGCTVHPAHIDTRYDCAEGCRKPFHTHHLPTSNTLKVSFATP